MKGIGVFKEMVGRCGVIYARGPHMPTRVPHCTKRILCLAAKCLAVLLVASCPGVSMLHTCIPGMPLSALNSSYCAWALGTHRHSLLSLGILKRLTPYRSTLNLPRVLPSSLCQLSLAV